MPDHKKQLAAAVRKAQKSAQANYVADNPAAARLRLKSTLFAYEPRLKGVTIARWAMQLLLEDRSYVNKSNKEIIAYLRREWPDAKIPENGLLEPLKGREKAYVAETLREFGYKINLEENNTMSAVKLAMRGKQLAKVSEDCFEVDVTFSATAVTVGDRSYPIQLEKGFRRIHIGKSKLNVEVLKQFLASSR
jgi:hypothetical protein